MGCTSVWPTISKRSPGRPRTWAAMASRRARSSSLSASSPLAKRGVCWSLRSVTAPGSVRVRSVRCTRGARSSPSSTVSLGSSRSEEAGRWSTPSISRARASASQRSLKRPRTCPAQLSSLSALSAACAARLMARQAPATARGSAARRRRTEVMPEAGREPKGVFIAGVSTGQRRVGGVEAGTRSTSTSRLNRGWPWAWPAAFQRSSSRSRKAARRASPSAASSPTPGS